MSSTKQDFIDNMKQKDEMGKKKKKRKKREKNKNDSSHTLFFFYKNVVFAAQAEYSYFSADFRLTIFLYYS